MVYSVYIYDFIFILIETKLDTAGTKFYFASKVIYNRKPRQNLTQ